ncbi:hypothetical protein WJ968_20215 [Achromobacter xylosoxidans]
MLRSASRLVKELTTRQERELMRQASASLALLERNRQMVDIGAYQSGANPALDAALAMAPRLDAWLRQDADAPESRAQAYAALAAILGRQEEDGV